MHDLLLKLQKFLSDLFASKSVFNTAITIVQTAQYVSVMRGCAGFMFTNTGDTIAFVNGMIIYPGVPGTSLGDSRSIACHKNDVFKGNIQVRFQAPVNALPQVEIVQIFYANEQE